MIVHQTPRLFLKCWALDDFDAFAVLARDPRVVRYISEGEPWSDERIERFVMRQQANQRALGFCNWKLINRANGDMIGFCGLDLLETLNEVEIGWWLRPDCWGQGFALEAARYVSRAAFERHGLKTIVARAYQANEPSLAIMKQLGMRFDCLLEPGPRGDILLFRLDAVFGSR